MYIKNENGRFELGGTKKELIEKALQRSYKSALLIDDGLSDVLEMGGMLEAVRTLIHTTIKTACWSLEEYLFYGYLFFEEGDNVPWNNVCEDINRRFHTHYECVSIPDANEL